MGRRRSGCILMILGVIVALAAGGVTYVLVGTAQQQPKAADVPKRPVLVAVVNIPERTIINPTMVRVVEWPSDTIPLGAMTALAEGDKRFTTMPIFAGQAILASQTADTKGNSGIAYALEKGKVLVAINAGGAAGILSTGAVRVGDSIDLIVSVAGSRGTQIAYTYPNLKIVAMGSVGTAQNPGTATGSMFIFQVTPQDALILKFLETLNVDMVLRAAGDETIIPTEPVNMDYIINKYRLQRPAGS